MTKAIFHRLTNPLVHARKKLVSSAEKALPSISLDEVLETQVVPQVADRKSRVGNPAIEAHRIDHHYAVSRSAVRVDPHLGLLFKGTKVVWASSDWPYRERDINLLSVAMARLTFPEAILGHGHFSGSYYHFFDDFLAKFAAAELWKIDPNIPLLVPQNIWKTPFYIQAKSLGVFNGRELIELPVGKSVRVDRAHCVRPAMLDREIFDWVCVKLGARRSTVGRSGIFLDRSSNFGRRIVNRDELEPVLRRYKLQLVVLEDLPLKSQVELFANANLIVGSHGAGLVNMMFSENPCGIIELSPSGFPGSEAYREMARQRSFSFRRIVGQSEPGKGSRAGFKVDSDQLSDAIASVLETG